MISLPSALPTDNLYKFMALSGLILCVFMLIYPQTLLEQMSEKLYEQKTQSKILNVELDFLTAKRKRLLDDQERHVKRMQEFTPEFEVLIEQFKSGMQLEFTREEALAIIDKEKIKDKEMEESWKKLQTVREDLDEESKQLDIKTIQRDEISENIKRLTEDFDNNVLIAIVFAFLGAIISIAGFGFWYVKVQEPTDRLLRTNLLQARKADRMRVR